MRDGLLARPLSRRAIQAYYLATPAFAGLDLVTGLNVRAAFLDGPLPRFLYYAVAFGAGLAATRWPARAPMIGLVDSGISIAWLVLAVGARYLGALDAAAAEETLPAAPFTPLEIGNLVLSTIALTVSWIAAMAAVHRRGPPVGP